MNPRLEALYRLSTPKLRALAASLRDGPLSLGITKNGVRQLAGPEGEEVFSSLEYLEDEKLPTRHIALFLETIADVLDRRPAPQGK